MLVAEELSRVARRLAVGQMIDEAESSGTVAEEFRAAGSLTETDDE